MLNQLFAVTNLTKLHTKTPLLPSFCKYTNTFLNRKIFFIGYCCNQAFNIAFLCVRSLIHLIALCAAKMGFRRGMGVFVFTSVARRHPLGHIYYTRPSTRTNTQLSPFKTFFKFIYNLIGLIVIV